MKAGGSRRGKSRKGEEVAMTRLSQSRVKRARLERGCKLGYVMPSSSDDEYVEVQGAKNIKKAKKRFPGAIRLLKVVVYRRVSSVNIKISQDLSNLCSILFYIRLMSLSRSDYRLRHTTY